FNDKNTVDIIVYEHPVYSDSKICELVKFRSWEQRESKGMEFSSKGVQARKKKAVKKSSQGSAKKSSQASVKKSSQGSVKKS
ncbi:hypothetical protein, partial [Chryseobacterium sp. SIMBA_028]